jgi:hypothetical protein
MIRTLIVPAALLALAACAESPTSSASLHSPIRHDANAAIGSGAGLAPPDGAPADGPLVGSGNDAPTTSDGGQPGSGARADAAPGIGAGVGLLPWDESGQLGSGNDVAGSTHTGAATLAEPGATISSTSVGSGARTDRPADGVPQPGSSAGDIVSEGGILGSGT